MLTELKKYALLDTDFVSKLYITKIDDFDRLIYRILSIEDFEFVSHQQTYIELERHNKWAYKWLSETQNVKIYTDRELIQLIAKSYNMASYGLYTEMLRRSCEIFSSNFFDQFYVKLEGYMISSWGNSNLDEFISLLQHCDTKIGADNNLGEIKLYTMAQVLEFLDEIGLYLFCSDDKKARYALSSQVNMECVSALASFYLAKKYLNMPRHEAQSFFDSWMKFHESHKQDSFYIYTSDGHQREKVKGQEIFAMLYDNKLNLMKDGFLCMI